MQSGEVRTKVVCGTEEKEGVDGEREAREFLFFAIYIHTGTTM
jgi:hypothetical protein